MRDICQRSRAHGVTMGDPGLSTHIDLAHSVLDDIVEHVSQASARDPTSLEGLLLATESLFAYVVQIESYIDTVTSRELGIGDVIESVRDLTAFVTALADQQERQAKQQRTGGRPKLIIAEGQLRELLHFYYHK